MSYSVLSSEASAPALTLSVDADGSKHQLAVGAPASVPRGKAKAAGDDNGDDDYDAKGEKWSKEMLPFEWCSRPAFTALQLASIQVAECCQLPRVKK